MFERKPCTHCSNKKVNHTIDKVDEIGEKLLSIILCQTHFRKLTFLLGDIGLGELMRICVRLGLYQRKSEYDRTKILSRSIVLLDEAKERGMDLAPLVNRRGIYTDYFSLQVENREHFFEALPIHHRRKAIDFLRIDDKYRIKCLLKKYGFPHAPGRTFLSKHRGKKFGVAFGYPLVVKPRYGSQSVHVTMNIRDAAALSRGIDAVKQFKQWYLVERYVPGIVHRVTIVNNTIFAIKRLSPTLRGDGKRSIHELIEEKNAHPFRGNTYELHRTIYRIPVNDALNQFLGQIGYTLQSVLPEGTAIRLTEKINLATGADLEDVTDVMHPDNREMFFRLARLLNTDILGIDFICTDIRRPWYDQAAAIIECNSVPSIDMHHFPSIGEPQNVASRVLDLFQP